VLLLCLTTTLICDTGELANVRRSNFRQRFLGPAPARSYFPTPIIGAYFRGVNAAGHCQQLAANYAGALWLSRDSRRFLLRV